MKLQVGRFTCELSIDDDGRVHAQWLPWQPKYLNRGERAQYQAGRAAFLESRGGVVQRRNVDGGARRMKNLGMAIAVAALLDGCARGGGIGLEAMLADHNCEQAGYQLGTPQYTACRMELARRSAINNAAMQDFYFRQAELARQNQPQMCSYNGSTIGGITSATATCR